MQWKYKIYISISNDLSLIDKHLETRIGSRDIWNKFKVKYKLIIPEFIEVISEEGKSAPMGGEFDYRSELRQLKESFLTWILINKPNIKFETDAINNEASQLLSKDSSFSHENKVESLIAESKVYISKETFKEKKIGLEKIWDAFERIKTIRDYDKKESVEVILKQISEGNEYLKEIIENEMLCLTSIGNRASIRHSEIGQKEFPNEHYLEYLYFRMLSLISFINNKLN